MIKKKQTIATKEDLEQAREQTPLRPDNDLPENLAESGSKSRTTIQVEGPIIVTPVRKVQKNTVEQSVPDKKYKKTLKEGVQKGTKMDQSLQKPELQNQFNQEADTIGTRENQEEKIEGLKEEKDRELYRLKSVFPFELFPDEIIIREHKISVIRREFFSSGEIRSFDLKELHEILLLTGPFLSTLRFVASRFAQSYNTLEVKNLVKSEAAKARAVLQGLIAMDEKGINMSLLDENEILKKAEELGDAKAQV